jgi:hypothetical protein
MLFRDRTLSLYKSLLRQSKQVENESNRISHRNRIKSEFRQHKDVENMDQIESLLKKGNSSLSFLKTITPKIYTTQDTGSNVFVIKNGQIIEKTDQNKNQKALSNWREGNIDPDALKKHEQLLKRQQFQAGPLKGYDRRNKF